MRKTLSYVNLVAFMVMIAVNALANALPINGYTTGEIAAMYPNLFVPAGFTFSIWGLIYLMLGIWVFGQVRSVRLDKPWGVYTVQMGWYFTLSCILNAAWIFAWHYRLLLLSLFIMFALLFTLKAVYTRLRRIRVESGGEKVLNKVPFSIYFGWISVAAIANTAAFLVDRNWNRWGQSEVFWYVIVIAIASGLAVYFLYRFKDYTYPLVMVWAFFGIASARTENYDASDLALLAPLTALVVVILFYLERLLRDRNKFVYSPPKDS